LYEGLATQENVTPHLCVLGATRSTDCRNPTLELAARNDVDDDQLGEGMSDCISKLRQV
jgi:hypothetical protein